MIAFPKINPAGNPFKVVNVDLESASVLYAADIEFDDYVYKMQVRLTKDSRSKFTGCRTDIINLNEDYKELSNRFGEETVRSHFDATANYINILTFELDDFLNLTKLERNAEAALTALPTSTEGRKRGSL